MWGPDDDDKSNLVDILHKGLINGWFKNFEGVSDAAEEADHVGMLRKGIRNRMRKLVKVDVDRELGRLLSVEFERHSWGDMEFERHSWVDVPSPFDFKVFAQRLFLNFYSDDIRANEIMEVGSKGSEAGLIQRCCRFLFEEDCLIVINGLQSRDDWDQIERTLLLSSNKATTAKACIIVITNEETVATYCVKDHKHQAFNVKDLMADTSISSLVNKVIILTVVVVYICYASLNFHTPSSSRV